MHLYSLTLQKASGITAAVFGNFSGPKQQELIVARGKILELMRPDDNGKVQTVFATEVFGIIRSITTFRLTGAAAASASFGIVMQCGAMDTCKQSIHNA